MKKGNRYVKRYLTYLFALMLILSSASTYGEKKAIPWLQLLLFDEESEQTQVVGPEGGTFKFPNGVVLDIPEGAVTEKTTITVKDVPCGKADPILSARQFASHDKRCIGGFSAEPDGLVFNTPIKATVPVLPLNPGEIPVQIQVDLDARKYWIAETDLVHREIQDTVEITIQHFSDYWLAVLQEHIDEVCGNCATWDDPAFIPICENLDLLQPNCCLLRPAERNKCAKNCDCCREKEMIIKASGVDFSHGDCQILGDDVEVTFPYCPHSPTESYAMAETSAGCPEDMNFEITVQPPSLTLSGCQEANLTATITGKSKDGKTTFFTDSPLNPFWESSNPQVASISQDGTIRGISKGTATVQALVSKDSPIPPGEVQVTVTSNCGMSGVWHLTPVSQYERCRYGVHDWWEEDPFSSFDVRVRQGPDSDSIVASFVPDTGAVLTGTWNANSGEFNLSTDTSDVGECGYLFYGSDICGDAVGCKLVSCQNTTDISGSTSPSVTTLDAESTWYYSVTFSYENPQGGPPGQNTWECEGSATLRGSRL